MRKQEEKYEIRVLRTTHLITLGTQGSDYGANLEWKTQDCSQQAIFPHDLWSDFSTALASQIDFVPLDWFLLPLYRW